MKDGNQDLIGRLRTATRPLHERLEQITLGDKIMDGTLTAAEYRRLIDWQERAHRALEPGLDRVPIGGYRYEPRFPVGEAAPPPLPEAIGILYVLEGASLGGSLIYRKLAANPRLADQAPFPFYRNQSESGVAQWRNLLEALRTVELADSERERAAESAKAAFLRFEAEWEAVA